MKRLATLGVLCLCSAAFAGPRLFVPNHGQNTVSVFDQANLPPQALLGTTQIEVDRFPETPVIDRIPVGPQPRKVAVTPDGRWAFSANSGSTGTNGVTWFSAQQPYSVIPVSITTGSQPRDIAIARKPDGAYRVVTANWFSGTLTFFQPTETPGVTNVANRPVTGVGGVSARPEALFTYAHMDAGGSTQYVYVASSYTNLAGASVSYYDASQTTPTAQGTFALPASPVRIPKSLAITYDARYVFIASAARDANGNETNIGYLDIYNRGGSFVRTFGPFNNLQGLGVALNGKVSLDPRTSKAYVSFSNNTAGYVYIIRIRPDGTIEPSVTVRNVGPGAQGLDVAPDDSSVWIANRYDNSLSIIDGDDDDAITEPPISGSTPTRIRGGDGTMNTTQPLVQPYSVTFVPEDLRTFNTDIYGSELRGGWTMYGGGAARRGVARSPLDELMVVDPLVGPYAGTTDPARKAWSVTLGNVGYHILNGYGGPVYVNASPIVGGNAVIVATYTGNYTGGVTAYEVTGNGYGQPLWKWSDRIYGPHTSGNEDFLSTPVYLNNDSGSGIIGGEYVICVSVDGNVYAIAASQYEAGMIYNYQTGQYDYISFQPGDVMWQATIRSPEGYIPHVISSLVRYKEWVYATVGWRNGAGQYVGSGLVRISANPYYDTYTRSFQVSVRDYFRAKEVNQSGQTVPIARRVYSSPAVDETGNTAGIVFGVTSSAYTVNTGFEVHPAQAYVFKVPVQEPPVTSPAWVSTISPSFPGGYVEEVGSPSVGYGKVFIGTHGTWTETIYGLNAATGAKAWGENTMLTDDCGVLQPPALFDGNVHFGYDEPEFYSRLAETGQFNPRWGDIVNISGNGEYFAPIITTSGTILHQTDAANLTGINIGFGPTYTDPHPLAPQTIPLGAQAFFSTLGASPATTYVKSRYVQDPLSGRWTFALWSDQEGISTLQSVFKNFQW